MSSGEWVLLLGVGDAELIRSRVRVEHLERRLAGASRARPSQVRGGGGGVRVARGRAETACVSEELQMLQGQVKIRSTSHESAEEGLNDDHVRKRCLRTVCHGTLSSPIVVDQLRSDGEMWFV